MSIVLVLLAALQAPSAEAVAADPRPVLWQNVHYGVPRAEIEALYPIAEHTRYRRDRIEVDNFNVTGNCQAEVNIYFEEGLASRVFLKGKGSPTDGCPDMVLNALAARYGRALVTSVNAQGNASNGFETSLWAPSGISIEFSRQMSGTTLGIGLFRGSWELSYRPVDTAAAL